MYCYDSWETRVLLSPEFIEPILYVTMPCYDRLSFLIIVLDGTLLYSIMFALEH